MDTYHFLIPLLSFGSVFCLGSAVLMNAVHRRKPIRERLDVGEALFRPGLSEESAAPLLVKVAAGVGKGTKASPQLRARFVRAGFNGANATAVYFGSKTILFVLGIALMGALGSTMEWEAKFLVCAAVAGGAALFFLPNIYLWSRTRYRMTEINDHLPDVVDLLEICVSGGMGLDMAWNAATEEIRTVCPVLGDEMALTNLEIHLGEERGSAIRHMAERTGVNELLSLVAVLVQSQKFGTSVSDALRVFAQNMREVRSQKAEEHAEQMAVKMLFPMVLLIFPVVLIVAVGPAGITLRDIFAH